eukprot:3852380-Pleurochrysis_carterae.AAC.1
MAARVVAIALASAAAAMQTALPRTPTSLVLHSTMSRSAFLHLPGFCRSPWLCRARRCGAAHCSADTEGAVQPPGSSDTKDTMQTKDTKDALISMLLDGLAISSERRADVSEQLLLLERTNPTPKPTTSSLLNGVWELKFAGGLAIQWLFRVSIICRARSLTASFETISSGHHSWIILGADATKEHRTLHVHVMLHNFLGCVFLLAPTRSNRPHSFAADWGGGRRNRRSDLVRPRQCILRMS